MKWLVGAVALVAALAGLVWLYGQQMNRAREDGKLAERTVWQAREAGAQKARADLERDLAQRMAQRFDDWSAATGQVRAAEARISVQLPRAVAADPRYSDPRCELTPEVREQLNAARALSQGPTR